MSLFSRAAQTLEDMGEPPMLRNFGLTVVLRECYHDLLFRLRQIL
jgi:hypothetical protein